MAILNAQGRPLSGESSQTECDHGIVFDRAEADCLLRETKEKTSGRDDVDFVMGAVNGAMAIRKRWPRGYFTTALDFRPGWGAAWLSLGTGLKLAADPLGDRLVAEGPAAAALPAADYARYAAESHSSAAIVAEFSDRALSHYSKARSYVLAGGLPTCAAIYRIKASGAILVCFAPALSLG